MDAKTKERILLGELKLLEIASRIGVNYDVEITKNSGGISVRVGRKKDSGRMD